MSHLTSLTRDDAGTQAKLAPGARAEVARHLSAFAGLRTGELFALRWSDVDFDEARIHVRHAVFGVPYETIKTPSWLRRKRSVDLETGTVTLLQRYRMRQRAEQETAGARYRDHDLVVCREDGTPLHPRSFSSEFALGREEILALASGPPVRPPSGLHPGFDGAPE